MFEERPGERALPFDPAALPGDAHVVFIGRIRSPWTERASCPRNMNRARETGEPASLLLDPAYLDGLEGLEKTSHIVILSWLDRSPRTLIVQKPHHAPAAKGTFALRSPVRPNPVGLHVVRLTGIDRDAGILHLEAIDVLDGTPVIDIKPYMPAIDAISGAETGRAGSDAP
ncbi:MAG: tRNA (N6-threonylcarbamoyladenosine(37)-N6)-methyltransferase TrmO [Notoacmeibacter sp.]|nr:tRNA (N6-threonylcarbamoyladenosine(37)-N6)-methyltransferase TrmO [Notoacmeibacter sp.]